MRGMVPILETGRDDALDGEDLRDERLKFRRSQRSNSKLPPVHSGGLFRV